MGEIDVTGLLRRLDGPVEPSAELREEMWRRIAVDIADVGEAAGPADDGLTRGWARWRGPLVAAAAAVIVLVAGLVVMLAGGTDDTILVDDPTTTTVVVETTEPQGEGSVVIEQGVITLPDGLFPVDADTDGRRLFVLARSQPDESGGRPAPSANVVAIDLAAGQMVWRVELGDAPSRVAFGEGAVWVAHFETGAVTRLDPDDPDAQAQVTPELPFDVGSGADRRQFVPADLKVGFGSVWMSTARGAVARISADGSRVEAVVELSPGSPGEITIGEDAVWVAEFNHGLTRIDPGTNQPATIPLEQLDHSAGFVAAADGVIWVAGDRLARRDDGSFLTEDGHYVYAGEGQVSAIDPDSLDVVVSARPDGSVRWLGHLDAFFGLLDTFGVFHHLVAESPAIRSWNAVAPPPGDDHIVQLEREAWRIDNRARTLTHIRETGPATVGDLPVPVGDPSGPREIPAELASSPDWTRLSDPPIAARWPGVEAWTGEELVIWGGETRGGGGPVFGDGAAYDPESGSWRQLAPSPLGGAREPGWVWTGEELIIWTATGAAGWDPDTNTWNDLGRLNLSPSFYRRAVWTGTEIIDTLSGFAVDPQTGSSRRISEAPPIPDRAQAVWTGDVVVVLPDAGIYDLANDTWSSMPDSGLTPLAVDGAAVDGRVIAADYVMYAASYQPAANTWMPLPQLPLRFGECSVDAVPIADTVVIDHCSGVAIFDTATETWMPLAHPNVTATHHGSLLAGDAIYHYGTTGFYRLAIDLANPWEEASRAVIGIAQFDRPAGWRLGPLESTRSISMRLTTPSGASCTLTALRGSAPTIIADLDRRGATVEEVTPRVGGSPYQALHAPSGMVDANHHLYLALLSTDVFDASCPDLVDARTIIENLIWPWEQ